MRVAIAGAGAVGRSIARELVRSEHDVMLIERKLEHIEQESVPEATWVHADACELSSLEAATLETYEVVIAATGDDKANLVLSLLAKTEFGVRRVVARVNDPATNGCSTNRGASTWRCRRHGCWRHSSRRRCRSATWFAS